MHIIVGVLMALLLIVGCGFVVTNNDWIGRAKTWVEAHAPSSMRTEATNGVGLVDLAADREQGQELILSVANAAAAFSVKAGGGGEELFPTNAFQISQYMPPIVARATVGCYTSAVKPLGGYVCQYSVDPGRTNFWCKALPANGYTGEVICIRKDLKIVPNGTNNVCQGGSDGLQKK